MSGTASPSVAVGSGGGGEGGELGYSGGYHAPFTAMQWQELANQAMIYKYLVAGLQVPPDLVVPIRRSFEALSARFFTHPSLGYCSYYGKKFDPEPGRCRRTDGKKWRCSKDAHPDSKYCERHMHRGRNRSRKPVESQSALQSLSTAMPHISRNVNNNSNSNAGNNAGNFQVTGSGSFQNVPLYSVQGSEGSSFGMDATKLQMETISCEMGDNKEFRYVHNHGFSPEASGSLGGLGLSSCGTWYFMPSQVSSTTSFAKQRSDPQLLNLSSAQEDNIDAASHGFEPMMSEQRTQQQGQEHEQHLVHPFFTEWPIAKASWSSLDDDRVNDGSNKNFFSSTQLSISIPRTYDFSSRSGYSPND